MSNDNIPKYVGKQIRNFRMQKGITQQELAEYLNTTSQTVSRYENGILETNQNVLFALADYFDTSINNFFPPLKFDNGTLIDLDSIETVQIPVLGKIPAGMPFEAIEDKYTTDYIDIPKSWLKGGNKFFALILNGDSMEPKYCDNDIVIFTQTNNFESGQDCCVRINGFDATFKRVKRQENGIMIIPLNENNSTGFTSTFYTNEQIEHLPIEVLGVVKQIRRNV